MPPHRAIGPLILVSLVLALLPASKTPAFRSLTLICEIQGAGGASPLAGRRVATWGVVYAFEESGFYLQHQDCDGDSTTSDAIFVATAHAAPQPAIGTTVEVRARVEESFGSTRLEASDSRRSRVTTTGTAPLPAPTDLDAERARSVPLYYESLEHMRVRLVEGQAYLGTNRFGETFLVPGTSGRRIRRTDPAPEVLALDEGLIGGGRVHAFAFDRIFGAVGPLAFTFNNYKLRTEDAHQVEVIGPGHRPHPIIPPPPGALSVATWNLFADERRLGPEDPASQEQAIRRAKLARGILDGMGAPAVVAVQEVTTWGLLDALADQANQQAASRGQLVHYAAYLEEGNDPTGIAVGFLVDETKVSVLDVRQIGKEAVSDGRCRGGASGNLIYDRPPLLIEVRTAQGDRFELVSNHFKSMSGGTPENEFFELCRIEQAEYLRERLAGRSPLHERVVLLGDFNAFRASKTLEVLTSGHYRNTVDLIPEDRRFSFAFQGRAQFLDHIVASAAVDVLAADSPKLGHDVPFPLFENDPENGWAASDHDPIVAFLR